MTMPQPPQEEYKESSYHPHATAAKELRMQEFKEMTNRLLAHAAKLRNAELYEIQEKGEENA